MSCFFVPIDSRVRARLLQATPMLARPLLSLRPRAKEFVVGASSSHLQPAPAQHDPAATAVAVALMAPKWRWRRVGDLARLRELPS